MENEIQKIETCPACLASSWHKMGDKSGYSLYRCQSFKSISVLPVPALNPKLYGENYFCAAKGDCGYVNYDSDKEAMRGELGKDLAEIVTHCPEKGKLFDVGAATGYFISLSRDADWQVAGVELSSHAASVAREKGLDVLTGMLHDMTRSEGEFDVVTASDVIEHMPDPNHDASVISRMTKKGGLVVIVTPDASSLYAKVRGISWHLLVPPEHIHCFSRTGIRKFLDRHGYEILVMHAARKKFTLSYTLHVISRASGLKFLNRLSLFLAGKKFGNLPIPLNVRDNMFVIAKKK